MNDLSELAETLQQNYGEKITSYIFAQELTIEVSADNLIELCNTLKKPPYSFTMLIDLCGVDYLHYGLAEWQTTTTTNTGFSRGVVTVDAVVGKTATDAKLFKPRSRFAVVYHLLSIVNNKRIRIHGNLTGEPPCVPTVTNIWRSADWYEREAFDLFGILFLGHQDLRRILTDYGFIGHPFRKDFALIGEVEMRYDAAEQRVVYEPVSIEPRTLVPKVIRGDANAGN